MPGSVVERHGAVQPLAAVIVQMELELVRVAVVDAKARAARRIAVPAHERFAALRSAEIGSDFKGKSAVVRQACAASGIQIATRSIEGPAAADFARRRRGAVVRRIVSMTRRI